MAYEEAGVKDPRKEISLAEVHDCFTSTEVTRQLQGRAGVSMLGDDPGSVRLATALVSWRAKMR